MEPAVSSPSKSARKSGVVVPHKARWWERLLARLIYTLILCVAATLRFRWTDASGLFGVGPPPGPVIFATWHNRLALSLVIYRRHVQRLQKERRLAALVSASRDGGLLARILELFNVQPVRGSSSRRGGQALLELTGWAERGFDLAVTPDGPRGPCYKVQDGTISAAAVTGSAIIPVSYYLRSKIRLKSWDRFQIPLPFSRCEVVLGEPVSIARDADAPQREQTRAELERRLLAITRD